jgi:hypothetical protein
LAELVEAHSFFTSEEEQKRPSTSSGKPVRGKSAERLTPI